MSEVWKEIKYKLHVLYYCMLQQSALWQLDTNDLRWLDHVWEDMFRGGNRGVATAPKITEADNNPTPTQTTPVKEEQEENEGDVTMVKEETEEGVTKEELVYIPLGNNKYKYGCGNCNITRMASKNGMDAHIHKCHTKKALVWTGTPRTITSTFFVRLVTVATGIYMIFVKLNYVLFYWDGHKSRQADCVPHV